MSQDIHGQYTGKMYGQDRIGHITPDLEASDSFRPWLPVSFPAPWLPGLRQDQGHPKLATKVLSSQMIVGQDKSGSLVPAGMRSGSTGVQANHATGAGYYPLVYRYGFDDFAINPFTGVNAVPGVYFLAAPSNAAIGDSIPIEGQSNYVVIAADLAAGGVIANALACTLLPGGVSRPIGLATRDVYQYIGGVKLKNAAANIAVGMLYQLDPMIPLGFQVHNYVHEQGTAIQTDYVVRVPLIGSTRTELQVYATAQGLPFAQGYGRSFTHFTGVPKFGDMVAASNQNADGGNFTTYDPTVHQLNDVVGRVLGVINMIDKIGFMARVKTLWDPSRMVGPVKDPNPASIMMGGSATGGLPYDINLTTDGFYAAAKKNKGNALANLATMSSGAGTVGTYVLVRVLL